MYGRERGSSFRKQYRHESKRHKIPQGSSIRGLRTEEFTVWYRRADGESIRVFRGVFFLWGTIDSSGRIGDP